MRLTAATLQQPPATGHAPASQPSLIPARTPQRGFASHLAVWLCAVIALWCASGNAQESATPAANESVPVATVPAVDGPKLVESQEIISLRYRQFEKTLLEMAEHMRQTDPERASLLTRALGKSKEEGVSRQMDKLVELLRDDQQLGSAAEMQGDVVTELQKLVDLLMSDDRGQELAREKQRIEAYLKELNKLIAGQKDIRAGTERGQDLRNLAPRQMKLGDKAGDLQQKVAQDDKQRQAENGDTPPNESAPGEDSQDPQPGNKAQEGGKNTPKPSDQQQPPSEKTPSEKPGSEEKNPSDKPMNDKPGSETEPPGKTAPSETPQPGGNPSDKSPKSGQPQPGGEPMPGSESQEGGSESQESQSSPQPQGQSQKDSQKTPGREELERAQEAMQQALKKLNEAQREGAAQAQDEAVRELERAKAKLEEILRQIREEEKKLMLEGLESRLTRILEGQVQIYNETVDLSKVPELERTARHRLRSEDLSGRQQELQIETQKALTLLQEEGTAVAFPEALEQARRDMLRIAKSLKQFEIGELTQGMEKDVIDTLKEMIDVFQKELEKQKEQQQNPQQQQGGQQDDKKSLVEKIAELKMLRALQVRINQRTTRIGKLVSGETASDPDLIEQLHELADRQDKIQSAAYDLSIGKNE